MDATDAHILTNGRVEALEITLETQDIPQTKRKRGRPRTKVDESTAEKHANDTCKSSTHKKKKSDRKDVCLVCGKIVKANIKGHQAIHDKSEMFNCDICGFQTNVKLYMKNHMRQVHVAQRYEIQIH